MTKEIHIWSDYVCPFCLIADELIARVTADLDDVRVIHHPHELRPYPVPTLRPEDPYLPEVWQRSVYPMAEQYGVELRLPTISPQPYTAAAFRGFQFAVDQGLGNAYHDRLLRAFFVENLDIGRVEVLTELASDVGLDPHRYRAALDDPVYVQRHEHALAEAAELEIRVVPTIMIGQRRIDGVATEAVLRRALAELEQA